MESKMEIDSGRSPEPHGLSLITDPESIPTLDGWIESLMSCKQLAEIDVQRLCDRVGFLSFEVRCFCPSRAIPFFSFLFLTPSLSLLLDARFYASLV